MSSFIKQPNIFQVLLNTFEGLILLKDNYNKSLDSWISVMYLKIKNIHFYYFFEH